MDKNDANVAWNNGYTDGYFGHGLANWNLRNVHYKDGWRDGNWVHKNGSTFVDPFGRKMVQGWLFNVG